MTHSITKVIAGAMVGLMLFSCANTQDDTSATQSTGTSETSTKAGQSAVVDEDSQQNIVQVASSSEDHTTLVAAVQAAGLVDALANAGPFTVFAPTNQAFDALPAGTVDDLLKPENKNKLSTILQYHVSIGVYKEDNFEDGQQIGQAAGGRVTIGVTEAGEVTVNGAKILASVPVSNGIIHVIDQVLLPPQ